MSVYSRPECVFNYCPNPDECRSVDGCNHERELTAGELAMIDAAWEKHKAAAPVRVRTDLSPARAVQVCADCGRQRQYHPPSDHICDVFVPEVFSQGEHSAHPMNQQPKPLAELPAQAELADARECTCHPDDRPKGQCQKRYAVSECQLAAAHEQIARLRDALGQCGDEFQWRYRNGTRDPDDNKSNHAMVDLCSTTLAETANG